MVILFLIVLWAIVLGPSIYRRWFEGRIISSIGSFHTRLWESSGDGYDADGYDPGHFGVPDGASNQFVLPQPKMKPISPIRSLHFRDFSEALYDSSVRPERLRSSASLKRRRQILAGLLISLGSFLVLGVAPPLRVLWTLAAIDLVVLVGYCVLLIRTKYVATQSIMKVTHLRTAVPGPDVIPSFHDDSLYDIEADQPASLFDNKQVIYDDRDEFTNRRLRKSHYVYLGRGVEPETEYFDDSYENVGAVAVGGGR